jgi:hypothetical protein
MTQTLYAHMNKRNFKKGKKRKKVKKGIASTSHRTKLVSKGKIANICWG